MVSGNGSLHIPLRLLTVVQIRVNVQIRTCVGTLLQKWSEILEFPRIFLHSSLCKFEKDYHDISPGVMQQEYESAGTYVLYCRVVYCTVLYSDVIFILPTH